MITAFYGLSGGIRGQVFNGIFRTQVNVDPLSAFFTFILGLVGFLSSVYLLNYEMKPRHLTFAIAYNGTLLSALLFLTTENFEKMILFYELLALLTFALILSTVVSGGRNTARNYIVLTQLFGVVPLLIALPLTHTAGSSLGGTGANMAVLPVLYALLLLPPLVRSGVFPFHTWVPRVYRRVPSPVVPVLIVLEGLGIYMMIRLFWFVLPFLRPLGYVIAFLGMTSAFSILYSFSEIRLKRKFAYHSVMDVGLSYFALGSAMVFHGSLTGRILLIGALFHTLYQSVYKSSIFFGLGAIEHYGEEPNVCSLRKLFKGHVMAFLMSISAFSMAGLPPLAAFVSKWLIYQGAFMSGDTLVLMMFFAVAFLGLFPFASVVQVRRLNRDLCKRELGAGNVPLLLRGVVGTTAMLTVLLSVLPVLMGPIIVPALSEITGSPVPSFGALFMANVTASVIAVLLLTGTAYLGMRIGRIPTDRASELLLIFYNIGDMLALTRDFILETGRRAYVTCVLPVIKYIPRYELPLIRDCDDAFDYPVRHIDEAMFMPILRLISGVSERAGKGAPDMNALMAVFAVVFALLIIFLGVVM
ncbi:complex I subunit 5 family protein [Thermococcus sp.]|uniref:complex I subunit 5 family protein n=1 Tax=Thermococcus sp. TaxID=35749 RepID=UPI0025EF237C|nr:complex I subunit 5 family protein [Thermococcus sp.]